MSENKPVILYLDDEPDNLVVTKADLKKNFSVVGFSSPTEALKQVGTVKPSIVLSDLNIPGMNGVEFLELVQQIYPDAIRVIITGNSDEQAVIAAIKRSGVFDFIKKPYKGSELEDSMMKAYQKHLQDEEDRLKKKKVDQPDLMEHPSWLHKIANQLREAFHGLPQYNVSEKEIESWSLLIHLAMSAEKRFYHNTEHLFDISGGTQPIERIAILFHDVVYAQVDKNSSAGILPQVLDMIMPLVPNEELKLTLPIPASLPNKGEIEILYRIFGKKSGDVLTTMTGMNEFLSGLVAMKSLNSVLSSWDMIKVLSCIELTIPFRPKDENGHTSAERLHIRLRELNNDLQLGETQEEVIRAVERAVDVTNRDLWGFSSKEPGDFLNGSWKLILEGNTSLQRELHSPKDYRDALGRMEGFISSLKPEIIFQRIGKFPSDSDYAQMIAQCHYNLEAGRIYFRAKMVAMGIFEALNDIIGGNGPVEAFRGDIESATNPDSRRLENRLDQSIPCVPPSEVSSVVLELLKIRSETSIRYDFKNSPLALYIYSRMTKAEFENVLDVSRRFFKRDNCDGYEFLESFRKDLICSVLQSISEISSARQHEILQIKKLIEVYGPSKLG